MPNPIPLMIEMSVAQWQALLEDKRVLKNKNRKQKAKILDLTVEVNELKAQTIYQNSEIQRLLECYERDTLSPGLRFKTGIDIRIEHENLPGGRLLQPDHLPTEHK